MSTKNRKKIAKVVEPEVILKVPDEVEQEVSNIPVVTDAVDRYACDSVSAPLSEPVSEPVFARSPSVAECLPPMQYQRLCDDETVLKCIKLFKENKLLVWSIVLGVPLFILLFSKILLPIMLCVLSTFAYQELSKFLPAGVRKSVERFAARVPLVNRFGHHFYDGVRQIRPFLLAGVTFWSGPFLVFLMFCTYVRKLFSKKENYVRKDLYSPDKIIIEQSVSKPVVDEEDANFYHSPAFAITILGIFVLGIPAAVTIALYNGLGIDAILGHPSLERGFNTQIFLIGFYLYGVCWAMMSLFFRACFTYPLNFSSTAYDVILDENAIEKGSIKGWFSELIWYCYPEYLAVKMKWKDLATVKITQGGFGRLHPLPDTLFSKESVIYRVLNGMAAFTDAIVDRIGRCDFLELRAAGTVGQTIKLRLWQMNKEDRARVFYAIRKWAPVVVLPESVQQVLLGSTVLAETRYTQIWFDLLTSKSDRQRKELLDVGDRVKGGELEVVSKLDSGGQANVYLARDANNQTRVIKEFILTGDEDLGNLIESAADFENEGSILARVNHPNVVKLYDVFTEDRRVYLVLEHVEGQSLRRLVSKNGPVSQAEAVRIGVESCKVLTYLHSLGIVHRDFTPDNIILMPDGALKVIDFSVAGSSVNVKDGDCVGKHSYTPAEQFRGQPCPQSDLYALGATMYYLTVGVDPPPITQLHPAARVEGLSAAFDAIVAKSTANSLDERFETAAWLEVELSSLQKASYIIV